MTLMTEPVGLKVKGQPIPDEYDDYGNPVLSEGTTEVVYGWYEPRTSGEDVSAKDQQIDGYWVNLPLDAPLSGADAVVLFGAVVNDELVGGEDYQVVGEPGRQPGGFIVPGFIKAAVEKVTG